MDQNTESVPAAANSGTADGASRAALPLVMVLRVFLPFALGYFLSYIFRTVNSVIAPNLVGDAGLDATDLGFLTSVYFLAFAAFQLPLGVLLDRFGPRRVEAVLLLFAGLGAFLFSVGQSLTTLAVGRALIGFGVSGCMMASFKAFVLWFRSERLPLVNGWLLAFGATGAIAATGPVEAALSWIDWRAVFVGLAVFSAAVAIAVFFVVPEHDEPVVHPRLKDQLAGLGQVFRDPFFWKVTPLTTFSQAAFLAVQGLWAGPWLRDVAGMGRHAVAGNLSIMGVAIVAGFVVWGSVTERLHRRGVEPITMAALGMGLFIVDQLVLVTGYGGYSIVTLFAFGFFGTAGTLSYAVLSQAFPRHLAGRVNTGLNLLVFVVAFLFQWGMGAIIHHWEDAATHRYGVPGYQLAFGIATGLQVMALIWFLRPARRRKAHEHGEHC